MLACAFQFAGVRLFDIRDLSHPKEIAYWKAGGVRKAFLPGSLLWNPSADRTMDRLAGYPRFYTRVPGNGRSLEIWVVSSDNGFQILSFEDGFIASNPDLFAPSK